MNTCTVTDHMITNNRARVTSVTDHVITNNNKACPHLIHRSRDHKQQQNLRHFSHRSRDQEQQQSLRHLNHRSRDHKQQQSLRHLSYRSHDHKQQLNLRHLSHRSHDHKQQQSPRHLSHRSRDHKQQQNPRHLSHRSRDHKQQQSPRHLSHISHDHKQQQSPRHLSHSNDGPSGGHQFVGGRVDDNELFITASNGILTVNKNGETVAADVMVTTFLLTGRTMSSIFFRCTPPATGSCPPPVSIQHSRPSPPLHTLPLQQRERISPFLRLRPSPPEHPF